MSRGIQPDRPIFLGKSSIRSESEAGSLRYGPNQRENDKPILNPSCDAYKPAVPVGGWKPPLRFAMKMRQSPAREDDDEYL